tara:strand:- start:5477 stop:7072 length:1596 start_codon:yes stop_codon:yes gene_type:complete
MTYRDFGIISLVLSFFFFSSLLAQTENGFRPDIQKIDNIFFELNENLKRQQGIGKPYDIALARLKLGSFCEQNGVFTEAIDQFNKAIMVLEGVGHDTLYVDLVNRIGSIHLFLKNYDIAEGYFQNGILEATNLGNLQALAFSKSNLGACYEKKRNYLKALQYQNESLLLYNELKDTAGVSIVNENIGSIYEDLEDFSLAQQYFEKALAYHGKERNARLANILNNLGDVYRKTGVLKKALVYTEESLAIAQFIGNRKEEVSAYRDLSKSYNLLHDYEAAFNMLSLSTELEEENNNVYNANQASALQRIYDTKEKDGRIQLLLQNNKIEKAQNTLLLISILAVLAITFIGYLHFRRKRVEGQKLLKYEQRILKAELDVRQAEEESLQNAIQLKNAALSRYSLHLSQKNKMLSNLSQTLKKSLERNNMDLKRKLDAVVREIDFNLAQEREWDEFIVLFKEIHPDFVKRISEAALDVLSPAELRLGILLRLNLSSKEIASILRLTPDSIRVARYRLRKKLPITSKEELSHFLMGF